MAGKTRMTLEVVAPESFQRLSAREAGVVEDISASEAGALLGQRHAIVEDPRRTASGTEEWWVFEVAGVVVGLCHRATSNDLVIYTPSVASELKADLEICFADRQIHWL